MVGWFSAAVWSLVVLLAGSGAAFAHSFTLTDVVLVVRSGGQFHIDIVADLDALALGAPSFVDEAVLLAPTEARHATEALAAQIIESSPEERVALEKRLRRLFETRVRVRFDGQPYRHRATFPDRVHTTLEVQAAADGSFFGVTARLAGIVPAGAREVTLSASRAFRTVHLTVLQQSGEAIQRQVLQPGEQSRAIDIASSVASASASRAATASGGPADSVDGLAGNTAGDRRTESRVGPLVDYVGIGVRHIVPGGTDHIAFLLALCLVSVKWRVLAVWVSLFTIGHTVSLALAALGLVSVSPRLVEPMIAVSVGAVAWRALRRREAAEDEAPATVGIGAEMLVVTGLGLLHGFGFAGALGEIGLPTSGWLLGLLGFNLGVEFGQLLGLFAAVVALNLASRVVPRERLITGLGLALLALSAFWTVERLGFLS